MMHKKGAAWFMILMILLLPISFSQAYAQNIRDVKAYGQDEVNGFLKEEDILTIEWQAQITGIDLSTNTEYLRIGPNGRETEFFGTCDQVGTKTFNCLYEDSEIAQWHSPWRIILCTDLDDCPGSSAVSKRVAWTIDQDPPTMPIFTIDKTMVGNDENLTLSVKAVDCASLGGCSGVKEIRLTFRPGGNIGSLYPDIISGRYENIYENDSVRVNPSQYITDGIKEVCGLAKDGMGNEMAAPVCREFVFDETAPSNCRILLVNEFGQEAAWFNPDSTNLRFKAEFTEAGVGVQPDKAFINLSSIGHNSLIQASTCNHDAEKWNCTFPPVNLDLSEDLSFNAYVRLTDRVRNGMPATACTRAFSLQVDDGVPILSSFTTSAGGYYGPGKTVTITADFEDEDAGIDPASVKATFSPLRVGTTVANNVVPTSHSGNTFTWADVKCAANCPAGPVSATVNAKDYAGNAVSDTAQFRMDDDPPDILPSEHDSGVMIDIYSTSDEDREDFAQNEMLHIEVLARDLESGSVWMSSNISKWSGHGNDDNRMVCAAPDDDSISVCSLEKPMRLANDGVLGITIGDALDNTVNITRLLTVYESDDEIRDFVVIDFSGFTYPGGYSLPPIDKFTIMNAPEYHAFVYFHLNHTGVCDTDDMAVLDSSLVGFCADSGVYVGAFYPDLGPEGSFEGFLELVLPKDYIEHNWDVLPYPPEDQLENNPCVLAVSVRCGSTVYATPEEEEIALLFKVALDTDHPAGPTDSKVREIKAIKDKYGSGFQKKLDDLNNLIEQGQRMCYIKQLLAHFGGVIMTIEATLNGLLKSLPGPLKYIVRPLTWTIDKIMQWTGNAAFGTVNTFLTGFCGFVTCEWNVNLFGVIGWEGGSDFMKSAQSFGLSGSVGGDSTLEVAKKSYIASVATLCLPGILYNLHKKRQAECYKAFCYEQQTVMGATFDQCDAQYGYYNCLANAGPFLQSEFAAIWEWINPIDDIIESLTNPVAMGWMGMKYASKRFCFAASEDEKAEAAKKSLQELASALQIQGAFQWISCSVFVLMEITEAVTMVMKMYDTYEQMQHPGQFDKDYCEAIGI